MNRFLQALLLTLVIGAISSAVALAQIPRTVSFQGVLADAQGILLADGTYTLTLSLYEQSTGGTAVFSESQQVTVVRGVFNAIIGATSPDGIPSGVAFDRQYWLGMQVNNGVELAPRTPFTSVPYALNAARALVALRADVADTAMHALHAGTADNATLADTAVDVRGGHVASINGQQGAVEILGAGSTIVTRQGNQFIIRSTDTSGGGIRRIDNYDGSLVIDPPQGPFVTMFIREGGVQTYHLRDMVVTTEKIANEAVTNAKLAPNAVTTDKIMDGQVMTADIADLNVTNAKLGPDAVTTDKIMDGQVMTADIADLNVTTEKLADGSVTNPKLGADAVTTDKIMDGQVMTADIADLNVTTEKLADGSVTNPKLGADAVTTDKIMDGQVMTADIADFNVTLPKVDPTGASALQAIIYDGANVVWGSPSPGGPAGGDLTGFYPNPQIAPDAVTSPKILDGQVMTADIADLNVTTEKLADGSVTNPKLGADAVTTDKILDGQVMTADIADLNVTTEKLADGSVTNPKLGADAVTTDKILDGQVMTADIADLNVTTEKLADGSVTNPKLGADAVTTDKILDGQVMTADIADLNVTTEKLADGSVTNPKLGADAVTTDKILDGQVMMADIADLNVTTSKIADGNVTLPKIDPMGALAGQYITFDGTNVTWGGSSAASSLVIPFSQSADEATAMVTLDNINASGDALVLSAVGGSALSASATTGFAVEARTTALASTAVDARSTNGMAFYGQTTGATYAASLLASGPASHGLRIQASEIGFNLNSGRFIGATGTATSGATLGRSRMIFVVNSTGADLTPATFAFPAVENGTIIIVTTNDPDGATMVIGATTFTITRDQAMMFVLTSDGWKGLP